MSLYIFGDSFAAQHTEDIEKINMAWTTQLSQKLNMDIKNFALEGSSLEYTYLLFNNIKHKLDENDIIIIVLTDLSRKWILKDIPQKTSFPMIEYFYKHDKKLMRFVEYYFCNAHNIEIEKVNLYNFTCMVSSITKHFKIKPLIMIAFSKKDYGYSGIDEIEIRKIHKNTAVGSLCSVSKKEYSSNYSYTSKNNIDSRLNHLSFCNHSILADKILKYILFKEPVDLSTDFITEIYDKKNVESL